MDTIKLRALLTHQQSTYNAIFSYSHISLVIIIDNGFITFIIIDIIWITFFI